MSRGHVLTVCVPGAPCRGGLMADDMGLGKTLVCICASLPFVWHVLITRLLSSQMRCLHVNIAADSRCDPPRC